MDIFAELGRKVGGSASAMKRLWFSVWVSPHETQNELPGTSSAPIQGPERGMELGFRLPPGLQENIKEDKALFNTVEKTFLEYKRRCPAVFQWLCRGGFQPNKIPEEVNMAQLKHACRVVGNLRAELLRTVTKMRRMRFS